MARPSFFDRLHPANVNVGVNSVFESLLSNISSIYKEANINLICEDEAKGAILLVDFLGGVAMFPRHLKHTNVKLILQE